MSARTIDEEKGYRDPQEINEYIKIRFEDVLAEPQDVRSPDWVWTTSHECFTCSRNCCYTLMSGLCGWLFSICWGFYFACVTFGHVWCCTPGIRNISINCIAMQRCFAPVIACWMAPVCDVCSILFSKITITQK